ncbi:MAG: hypothetical protein P8N56_05505 [Schleiferiaceae bacterium]|nr:hypothetical protein [Schleiferiaceae bacterium]
MKRMILWFVILLSSGTVGLLIYLGLFAKLEVQTGTEGGYLLGGFYHQGPYEEIGPTFIRTAQAADSLGFPTDTLIGVYFSDPENVPADSLESYVGAVMASGDLSYVGNIDPGHLSLLPIYEGAALFVDFPRKNDLSLIIGSIRVYPFLTEEAKKRGFEVGQVYEVYSESTIRYVFQAYSEAQDSLGGIWEE